MYFDMFFIIIIFGLELFIPKCSSSEPYLKYLQPIDVGRNLTYDGLIEDKRLCARDCTKYPNPRTCYYKLIVEQYHAMGPACKNCPTNREDCFGPQCVPAAGIERTILTFNRMLPGPAINVCYGDRVIVDVQNRLPAREMTVHWHGILMQKSPWMDGVPFVTQCPISANSWFRYDFRALTTGSHFYHSHSGLQLFDGLSGVTIVRTREEVNPFKNEYDYDLFSHTIHIQDWLHVLMDDKYPGYNKNRALITAKPDTYLINGQGGCMNPVTLKWSGTPFAEFHVKPNKRYRFRIVSATSTTCSYQFTVEGHGMKLIAADGYPVTPKDFRALYLSGGDMYDVIITTNQTPRPYWIRVQGVEGDCEGAFQQAILKYDGGSLVELPPTQNTNALFNSLPSLPHFNNMRISCRNNKENVCLDDLRSLWRAPDKILGKPYKQYIFNIGAHLFTTEELYASQTYHRHYLPISGPGVTELGGMFVDTINNKTNVFPPFNLLGEPENPLIDELTCPEKCNPWCECMHLIRLPYNEVFEMVFIDELSDELLMMDHPMHIHGHHFYVMKFGTKEDLSKPNPYAIDPNDEYPPIKDSIPVPAAGYAVMRFIADNPGFWVLHCHFQFHNMLGMVIVLQVGQPSEMLPIPADWPKCGNYLPRSSKGGSGEWKLYDVYSYLVTYISNLYSNVYDMIKSFVSKFLPSWI